ncbi:Zinc finger protein 555 [Araneus ventricosus]|uniref:Zinc finger protein 555 n=1 Tax=Araneus ventricosus TaxID=182803 RepID=A0A4Y2AHG9_ARAVE|nr:Zinc finger protein 555 [Araneus ventricosus]
MAQVLLDQKDNQLRLKRGLYEIAKKLITTDLHSKNNSKTASSRLRRRKAPSKTENNDVSTLDDIQLTPSLSIQEVGNLDLEDSESCDDPSFANISSVDSNQPSQNKNKGFSCIICEHIASSSQRLKEHLSRHTGDKHLQCEICGKKFAWRYSLRSHMVSHREDNPNKCSVCGKKYCNKSSVKNHMLRVHGNPKKDFKCDKCGKEFVTKPELKRHSYNHTKEKPFVCEYCGNSYRFKAALLVHYRIHSGEKPYKCGFCDKAFIHLSSAIGHRRRHTGEMPFQCNKCGKLFRVKRAMTAHMSVHSENKPFKCDKCGKAFKSRSGYRVHIDFHLGVKRHKCKYCEKTFRAWCNMHKHMKRHLNEKPQKCDPCGKTFMEKQELKNHIRSHYEVNKKCEKVDENQGSVVHNCPQIIPPTSLTCSATNIEAQPPFNESHPTDEILPTHIDMSDNQAVMYDCSLPNSMDKCQDKCQLLQDSYVSQFLYPQHSNVQYSQPAPMLNMYATDPSPMPNRSGCLSNMNSTNFNCIPLNNQNYNIFSYNLPNSDELLSKCKLCRSLFNSTMVLRSHLLEYHRIEEENIDALIT